MNICRVQLAKLCSRSLMIFRRQSVRKSLKWKGVKTVVKKRNQALELIANPSGSRIFGRRIERASSTSDAPTVKGAPLPKDLPESNVGNFVKAFAKINGVKPTRTRLDLFAEAVTRLAGDEVKLDQVGQTLVALRERKLVSGDEMIRLLHNHILEKKRVQPIR